MLNIPPTIKINRKGLATIKINSIFALFKQRYGNMKKRLEKVKMEVTYEEKELIESIRNYCNSYPNGYPQLLEFAQDIFDRITDMPK